MTAYLGPGLLTIPIKNYEVRVLPRHVAVNAVARDLVAKLWEHSGFRFVTTQTAPREQRQIMLGGVNVVAGQTCHRRRLEAAASFQQFDLAAMHVNHRVGIGLRQFKVFVERFAGKIGEGTSQAHSLARMAPGTESHLSVARKLCRIEYGGA
jgi:hypothetical protein